MTKRKRKTSKEHLDGAIVRRKSKKSMTQLSDLPMDILSSIISFLPIKEAIRTSILSSQWKYVWCHHTNLTLFGTIMPSHSYPFCPPLERRRNQRVFIKRVDDVLLRHSGAWVEQIIIHFDLHGSHTADVNRWITFAIGSKTRALNLQLWYYPPVFLHECESNDDLERIELYSFPFQLFDASNGSHLQFLHLASISMKLPADFEGFIDLRRLSLCDVNITDEDLQHLVSKCSFLEFLGVSYCKKIRSLRVPYPANYLKHMEVNSCSLLREIVLNNSQTILEYRGHPISFVSSGNSTLTNICIKLLSEADTSIEHLFTELPGALPPLNTLTSNFGGLERAISSRRHPKFVFLRNFILEMDIFADPKIKLDVLDLAYLLQAAPFMEKLELHMFMRCLHKPYRQEEDNKLRTLPPHPYSHLKEVRITGFFGHKDQLELALYILSNSLMLNSMKIDPNVVIADPRSEGFTVERRYLDGYEVATGFLQKADKHNVVEVLEIVRTSSVSKIFPQGK